MEDRLYNPLKLSEYRNMFIGKRVCTIGAGAVGTYLMEYFAKMGMSPDVIDFDSFTIENAAKHSGIIRTPEDAGRNKAECASMRVKPLLDEGCESNGINSNITNFGPEAFADYEYVILAVDNYAAKVLLDELIRQIPEERRPKVIMVGTYDEMASSVILDHKEFCIRCLLDEEWLLNGLERTSCVGPKIRRINGNTEIVRTSNLASSMAAHLCAEQIRADVIGVPDVMNKRITYTAYPSLELSTSLPMRKNNCPGCRIMPPQQITWLSGSVLDVTLGEAFKQIEDKLGDSDFNMTVHQFNFNCISNREFYFSGVCRCCGSKVRIMKHEGRITEDDLLCESCASKDVKDQQGSIRGEGEKTLVFNKDNSKELMDMTLFDLGYPLGAHIEVLQTNGAMDCLDEGKQVITVFAFDEDHTKIHTISKL